MKSNTIDDLEERLRVACHAAVPRLLDNPEETHGSDTDSLPPQLVVLHGPDRTAAADTSGASLGGIAAGLLFWPPQLRSPLASARHHQGSLRGPWPNRLSLIGG